MNPSSNLNMAQAALTNIKLPALCAESPGNTAPPLRILLVDDFAVVRELLATMLSQNGFEVDEAGDGASGWDAFCSKRYDLLVTDSDMPVLTGLEFVRRVREVTHLLPVIVISGGDSWDDADVETLLQPGAFVAKPFAFPVLRGKIDELVCGKRAASNGGVSADNRMMPLQPEHSFHRNGAIAGSQS